MRTSNYSVKVQVLYPTMRAIWNSCTMCLPEMSAMRGIYDQDYVDASLSEIDAAEALPNEAARTALYEMKRVEMTELATMCCSKWRFLKLYIRNSFATDVQDIAYSSAGWGDYEGAAHENWASVVSMMVHGGNFIATNSTQLQNGGLNMPTTFPDAFSAAATAFGKAWSAYQALRQEAEVLTAQKVDANNAIYAKTISMALDGQECFYNNDEIRKQFVWDSVTSLVAPGGPSGVIVEVTNAATGKPLLAEVTDINTDRTVKANADGIAEMNNLAAGDTTILITCDGFTQQAIDHTLKTSTTSRIKIALTPMVMEGMSEKSPEGAVGNGQETNSNNGKVAEVVK